MVVWKDDTYLYKMRSSAVQVKDKIGLESSRESYVSFPNQKSLDRGKLLDGILSKN